MIFDILTYSILAVGAVLTYVVFHLAQTNKEVKNEHEDKI